ncbi:MAG: hypothetical protein WAM58_18675 [Candidatus Acidiferrum sp.]
MHKLQEVQEAKELMNQAKDWSAFRWLFEKLRVRQTADRANAALDRRNRTVKSRWSDEVKSTYKTLNKAGSARRQETAHQQSESDPPEITLLLEKVIDADNAAHRARENAEHIFDEAERRMSTDLAKEGCKKAIHSWELHEKAIRKAEAIAESNPAEK